MTAAATIDYIGRLRIGQGRHAGKPFAVLPWQRRFLEGAFAPGVGESALSLARGGGKSTLTAALGCAALNGPLAQPAGEVLIVASSHEQGGIIFRHVLRFLGQDLDRKVWRLQETVNVARLEHRPTGALLAVKGSDPKRLHGAAPAVTICDEVAQWPLPRVAEMLSALRTAAGKIADSRMLLIGTRPSDEAHPFAVALRDADYRQVHAADPDDAPGERATWLKANPGLDHLPDLEVAIAREARAAAQDPALMASFKALRLNMGCADTEVASLLDAGLWARIERGDAGIEGRPVWGLDLGTSAAQSAVAAFWPSTGRLDCLAAFPCEPSLAERGLRDGVGALYQHCANRGELQTLGTRAVDIKALLKAALARFGRPLAIVADRWREAELRDALDAAKVPVCPVEVRGQGFKDGGEDVRTFRRGCAEGRVTPVESLLLRSAMAEARTVVDPAGNAKLAKNSEGGRRLRARDDAAAAAILAVSAGVRMFPNPSKASAPRRKLRSAVV